MNMIQGPFRWANIFLLISAMLHFVGAVLGGFGSDALALIPFGIVYAVLALGLARGWRWLGYVSFFALMIGVMLALDLVWAVGSVPGWIFVVIIVANILGALALFVALWQHPPEADLTPR
jgi:hypothetical protein